MEMPIWLDRLWSRLKAPVSATAPCIVVLFAMTALAFFSSKLDSDTIEYIGCLEATRTSDFKTVHQRTYAELQAHATSKEYAQLTTNNTKWLLMRRDANYFSSFLPYYSIRPLYISAASALTKLGVSPVLAFRIMSPVAYFIIGIIAFAWMKRYVAEWPAAMGTMLLMATSPIFDAGSRAMPDALAAACLLAGLFAMFELRKTAIGSGLLVTSVYIRTDSVLLVTAAFLLLMIAEDKNQRLKPAYGVVLIALAIGSVLTINHFAGSYGHMSLFAGTFISAAIQPDPPLKLPAMTLLFIYLSNLKALQASFTMPFLLLAVVALQTRSSLLRNLIAASVVVVAVHFALYPSSHERYFIAEYAVFGIGAVALVSSGGRALRAGPLVPVTETSAEVELVSTSSTAA